MRAFVPIFFGFTSLLCAAKTYHAGGVVIGIDLPHQSVTISHSPITHYMGAMVMPFRTASPGELQGLQPGNRVEFDLVVERERSYIVRVRKLPGTDLPVPVPVNKLAIGSYVPDFRLTDQDGHPFDFAQLRGKVVALNFLYTRCPLPDVCPRLAANFAALQRSFRDRLGKDLAMISITIDPEYDTPAILRDYSRRWGAQDGAWFFLTGPLKEIDRISGLFGLVSWAEEGTLSHTSSTVVVSREGKLVAIVEGSTYRLSQLRDLVQSQLGGV